MATGYIGDTMQVHPEIAARCGPPTAPTRVPFPSRRRFGAGILAMKPTHRAPASLDDLAWWSAEEARRAEDAAWDALAEVAVADSRFDGWY